MSMAMVRRQLWCTQVMNVHSPASFENMSTTMFGNNVIAIVCPSAFQQVCNIFLSPPPKKKKRERRPRDGKVRHDLPHVSKVMRMQKTCERCSGMTVSDNSSVYSHESTHVRTPFEHIPPMLSDSAGYSVTKDRTGCSPPLHLCNPRENGWMRNRQLFLK